MHVEHACKVAQNGCACAWVSETHWKSERGRSQERKKAVLIKKHVAQQTQFILYPA